jgi:two-component system, chemotaxis family, chemotaxis protein CheV
MSSLLKDIDARTRLAGTNKLEILLFTLDEGGAGVPRGTFGLNVFKVREIMRVPPITRAPDMPAAVEGMVSLRGALVPVIDLAKYVGVDASGTRGIMVITEYNGQTTGFLVGAVDTILRLDWSSMRVPPDIVRGRLGGLVTAVTELDDGRLVMMLDVEAILDDTLGGMTDDRAYDNIQVTAPQGRTVLFADDSIVARKQITRTLDAMHIKHVGAVNGKQAWSELDRIATNAEAAGGAVKDFVQLVLTDIEMPEMDGYMLARQVKADPRFAGIPVVMHSSLSGDSNRQLGLSVGVDEYVPKFEPGRLAQTLARLLA